VIAMPGISDRLGSETVIGMDRKTQLADGPLRPGVMLRHVRQAAQVDDAVVPQVARDVMIAG